MLAPVLEPVAIREWIDSAAEHMWGAAEKLLLIAAAAKRAQEVGVKYLLDAASDLEDAPARVQGLAALLTHLDSTAAAKCLETALAAAESLDHPGPPVEEKKKATFSETISGPMQIKVVYRPDSQAEAEHQSADSKAWAMLLEVLRELPGEVAAPFRSRILAGCAKRAAVDRAPAGRVLWIANEARVLEGEERRDKVAELMERAIDADLTEEAAVALAPAIDLFDTPAAQYRVWSRLLREAARNRRELFRRLHTLAPVTCALAGPKLAARIPGVIQEVVRVWPCFQVPEVK